MPGRLWICLAAAGLSAAAGTVAAQSSANETAEHNVRASRQYEALLCTNPAFRARRIAQECGPISDPKLHRSCTASFECGVQRRGSQKAPPSETIR